MSRREAAYYSRYSINAVLFCFFGVPFLMYSLCHFRTSMSTFTAIHCPTPCRNGLGSLELEGGEVRIEVCIHEEIHAVYAHLIDVAMLCEKKTISTVLSCNSLI